METLLIMIGVHFVDAKLLVVLFTTVILLVGQVRVHIGSIQILRAMLSDA
jgi:hypothetical protein